MSSSEPSSLNDVAATKQLLLELRVKRDALDSEAQAIVSELTAPQTSIIDGKTIVASMGIETPLVDSEGYPRADIDLYRARTLRKRFHELKTDRSNLQSEIERLLLRLSLLQQPSKQEEHQAEDEARRAMKPKPKYDAKTGKWIVTTWDGSIVGGSTQVEARDQNNELSVADNIADIAPLVESGLLQAQRIEQPLSLMHFSHMSPFARIESVVDQSPAQLAGMEAEDRIISFDGITRRKDSDLAWLLQQVSSRVAQAAASNGTLLIVVRRGSSEEEGGLREISLQPRPWAGRGLIGCHLVPMAD